MRYAVRNCSDPRDHRIHVTVEGPSRDFEDDSTTYVCPGGRAGDRRLRDFDGPLADLVAQIEREEELRKCWVCGLDTSDGHRHRGPVPDDGPDVEPYDDYDADYEADRAADRYERWLDERDF